jgi:hypothetical protein
MQPPPKERCATLLTIPQHVNPMLARFRTWRERAAPHAAYQLMPRFWTPAGLADTKGMPEGRRRAAKTFEPCLTGMAWTAGRLYLVVATREASYEHVAKLIHSRTLMSTDPDYAEQQGKRISALILCDDAPLAVLDFARRYRIQINRLATSDRPSAEPTLRSNSHLNSH